MSAEENKAIIRGLLEAVNKGLEAFLAARPKLYSHSEVYHVSGMAPLNYEAHEQFAKRIYAAFPDIQWTVEDLIAEGDKVVVRLTIRGTQKGEFQGIPASGKSASWTGIYIYRLTGGKIVETRGEADMLGLMQQLGVIPAPGQGGG